MKQFLSALIIIGGLFCLPVVTAAASANLTSLAPMLHKVLPSVVNVRAQIKVTDIETLAKLQKERSENNDANNSGLPLDKMVSIASGVIVDASKGYILTNAHV